MRHNYSNLICITLILVVTLIGREALGQNKIKVEELPNLAKKITNLVPEGKALFVFEAKEDYQFDSDNENIVQPMKEGLIYKLFFSVETSSGAITILNKIADKATINYGRDLFENSLPALKDGEIRYFKLSLEPMFLKPKLEFSDVTRQKKTEGAADLPTYKLRDALIIFNVGPNDLEIKFEGKKIDTVFKDFTGVYKVYVQPEDQVLILKSENYADESVPIGNLNTKEVRYYYVQQPVSDKGIESFDPNVKIGSYLIESNPSGALIQMLGQPDFNKQKYKTPYSLEGYKSGAEIITLSLNRYETKTDTIIISSSKGKRSKYNLLPTFAFINCSIEPPIPIAKVLMDGTELIMIKNSEDFECPKGIHTFEIVAPHYYLETRQINLAAGKVSEINIKLKPKMGSISILPGLNANNADVFVNEKSIGMLPIKNYPLQEGEYTIRYSKKGLVTGEEKYNVIVKENKTTIIKDVVMNNTIEIEIVTLPDNGASVYIDGKYIGKSNLSLNVGLGKHTIKIEKEYFEIFTDHFEIDEKSVDKKFTFRLNPLLYKVLVDSKPPQADVYLNGTNVGKTPITINATHGRHSVNINKNHYFKRTAIVNVSSSQANIVKKTLYKDRLLNVNAIYGLDSWGFEVGGTIKHFSMSFDAFPGIKNDIYSANVSTELLNTNFDFDSEYFVQTGQKYSLTDSTGVGFAIKMGFVVLRPFMMRIHGGYGSRYGFYTYEVYKATQNLTYNNGNNSINQGELVLGKSNVERFNSIIIGIEIPVFNTINLRTDYWFDSERGGGFVFGVGFIM